MTIGIGIRIDMQSSQNFSAAALKYKANIVANGGSISNAILAVIDTYLIRPLVASGDWALFDRLNFYAGLGSDANAKIVQRVCMIRGTLCTAVNSPTQDNNGIVTSGTGYLNLLYAPTGAGNYKQNDSFMFYVAKNPTYPALARAIGMDSSWTGNLFNAVMFRDSTPQAWVRNNSAAGLVNTNTASSGWIYFGSKRTNSTTQTCSINSNIQTNSSAVSQALIGRNFYELTSNTVSSIGIDGVGASYDTAYHGASGHGASSISETNVRTAINNTLAALGV